MFSFKYLWIYFKEKDNDADDDIDDDEEEEEKEGKDAKKASTKEKFWALPVTGLQPLISRDNYTFSICNLQW